MIDVFVDETIAFQITRDGKLDRSRLETILRTEEVELEKLERSEDYLY